MAAADPDATCSARTASGSSCQAAAVTVIEGQPFCHRKGHQKQAKPAPAPKPEPAKAAAPAPKPAPAPKAAPAPKPKLKVAPPAPTWPCDACGGTRSVDTSRDWPTWKADAGLKPVKCESCGATGQVATA